MVRDELSRICIYSFVERKLVEGSDDKPNDLHNICDYSNCLRTILSVRRHYEDARSLTKMRLVLAPGELSRYWKYHTPGKWFKKAKVVGKINKENNTMVLYSGAEISIVDTAFARKVGFVIDEN